MISDYPHKQLSYNFSNAGNGAAFMNALKKNKLAM
jgi:hypothetical protein